MTDKIPKHLEPVLKAAGHMAHVAGNITGQDLNGLIRRGATDVSVGELFLALPMLKVAVAAYNEEIILLGRHDD